VRNSLEWPLVSVIVLNMNGLHHLQPCFQSLMELDYPSDRIEFFLVDNASRDKSVRFMQQNYPQVRIIRNEKNEGFARANNQGAKAACGDYLAFINNDMRVQKGWLRELVEAVRTDDDIAAVGGKILTWDGEDVDFEIGSLNFYGMGFQPPNDHPRDDEYTPVLFPCGGSMLVSRKIFQEIGGFDEDFFAFFEDVDLGWRLWLLGYRVLYAPKSLTHHRGHGTASEISKARLGVLYERNALYALIKNYNEENLQRVLPVALMLLVRRALIFSRADKDWFRMPNSDSSGPPPFKPGKSWMSVLEPKKTLPPHKRWLLFAEEYGVWAAIKATIHLAFLWVHRQLGKILRSEMLMVSRHSLSHLVAVDDVIDSMPNMLAKRAEIQAKRKRQDSEILPLFRTPFQPHPPFEEYAATQEMLTKLFEIDRMFAGEENSG
jgi:GT2 family glycosyltransferase